MRRPASDLRKIRFRQSGDFAGLVRGAELALGSLVPAERARLEQLIARSGLAGGSAQAPSEQAAAARDLPQIEIEFESERGTAVYCVSELDLPEAAAPLAEWLRRRARPVPPGRAGPGRAEPAADSPAQGCRQPGFFRALRAVTN